MIVPFRSGLKLMVDEPPCKFAEEIACRKVIAESLPIRASASVVTVKSSATISKSLKVTSGRPGVLILNLYLPALLSTRFDKVATPLTAFTVVVLPVAKGPCPLVCVIVTAALLLAILPKLSRNSTTIGESNCAGRPLFGLVVITS